LESDKSAIHGACFGQATLKRMAGVVACALALGGCSTFVTYGPRQGGAQQTLKYSQGVGTLSQKSEDQEVFMYPAFKKQGTNDPTFNIGFANNSGAPVDFDTTNVKAFFRGQQIPIYTYTERSAEIESNKRAQQIALAIVGGLAAGAAAYGASHQTYTSNYSGYVAGRRGVTTFGGTNTTHVYDPMSGVLAGAAVAGGTALGIQQIEFNAQNLEQAAGAILQMNTVEPLRMVSGALILKGCCDPYPGKDDRIRFEVTVSGKLSVFEFDRRVMTQ